MENLPMTLVGLLICIGIAIITIAWVLFPLLVNEKLKKLIAVNERIETIMLEDRGARVIQMPEEEPHQPKTSS